MKPPPFDQDAAITAAQASGYQEPGDLAVLVWLRDRDDLAKLAVIAGEMDALLHSDYARRFNEVGADYVRDWHRRIEEVLKP